MTVAITFRDVTYHERLNISVNYCCHSPNAATFLLKAERNYLTAAENQHQSSDGYSRTIKSRLQKKIERFASEDLPILIEKG